ncbi:MAG TPA: ABC transporter permease [Gemmatimonadaceae bacterium]|nr:ABC transporter permease [Gemmatimonadaceae bacterium]
MSALRFIARRVVQSVPLLFVISLLVFALIHAAPGGPLALYLDNPNVRPEDIARLRHAMGLDRSLPEQYLAWLAAFVRGDWGYSYADGRPVLSRIIERIPATLELVGTSTLVALAVSLATGIAASVHRGVDRAATLATIAGISLPVFWFGLMLQIVFANTLGWFPSSGRASFGATGFADRVAHLILPAAVLASVHAAAWSRYLRTAMGEALRRAYVRAARARGLRESSVILGHALPNALAPFITVVLLDASIMVSGAVVTESVFAWPGVGSLFTESLAKRDYTVLMALLLCGSAAVIVLNLVADLVVRAIDPRVRESS